MDEHELQYLVAAILTAAALSGGTHPCSADTTVERFKELVGKLRGTGGLPPEKTVPHD